MNRGFLFTLRIDQILIPTARTFVIATPRMEHQRPPLPRAHVRVSIEIATSSIRFSGLKVRGCACTTLTHSSLR